MATQFESFRDTMKKVLMLDQADLDFGIYRIMNMKRDEIEYYLNNDLKAQVTASITANSDGKSASLHLKLSQLIETLSGAGVDPESSPKVKELREMIAASGNSEDLENEVYSHLTTFFSRYYDGGDFISQRRYKKDVYAIPYEGEEVKLYWANADQYYIKTGEYFRNYRFKLSGEKVCEFTLKDANTEQNNNVAQNNMERRFALFEETPVEVIDGELHINFTYELYPKATKQKTLMDKAKDKIVELIPKDFTGIFAPRPTDSDRNRTLLDKHLNDYVARNTFDYFIHKDLEGFLSRELDFYIKNEVLFIDDIDNRNPDDFIKHITVIKAIKEVGKKLITFLASLENYQKKLWLKKKFVMQADYCITLDRVPEELYSEICVNDAQREEWVRLFAIDEIKGFLGGSDGYSVPLTIDFLKANHFLVLDTQFFTDEFKHRLIASIDNIDEQCDGLLINSDNFQALNLLQKKYEQHIKGIYIDPPYNTAASEIIYKNNYKKSSWASLLYDRLVLGNKLLNKDGIQCTTIDDFQYHELYYLLNSIFGDDGFLGSCTIKSNPQGRSSATGFQISHEYGLFFRKNDAKICRVERNEEQLSRYSEEDDLGPFEWRNFRAQYSQESATMIYPIYIKKDCSDFRLPLMEWNESEQRYDILENQNDDEIVSWPKDENGRMRTWKWGIPTLLLDKETQTGVRKDRQGIPSVYYKGRMKDLGMLPFTIWDKPEYSASTFGANIVADILGKNKFSYPKSIYAVMDSLRVESDNDNSIFLDYFAGSGTTGHAVINLNRDGGQRKYILCEMGEYFNNVTKPRIEKVIYSKDWSNGKPVSREGISQCFKYMRLEQYEDTLNNMVLQPTNIDHGNGDFYHGYLLGYLLDTETKESLFSLKWFRNPWAMKLNITKNNEMKEETIDLVETFNYLIGLNVKSVLYPKDGICTVEGVTRKGEKTLIIWRDCDKISNEALNDFFVRSDYATNDNEFDRIYVNGDNNLQNLHTDDDSWKVVLTEQEFQKRMFEDC